jgi:hypothetical protein
METFLNRFRQLSEVNFQDSRFALKHNAVRFNATYGDVFVFLSGNRFEVLSQCD